MGIRGILILFFSLIFYHSFSQTNSLKGKVLTNDKPQTNVIVNLKDSLGSTLHFQFTDSNGEFIFDLQAANIRQDLYLEVRKMGYETMRLSVFPYQNEYIFSLRESSQLIDEVLIKKRLVEQSGDTIRYDVNHFADNLDRSIGDVLRKIPGITISKTGKISYNGQEISNFYIDGDDLLQDRYALGSRIIPHDIISRLEILTKHEPVKLHRDKNFSNKVAINLLLKDDAKLQKSLELDLGLGLPKLYDFNLNSLVFNRKIKTLNTLRANNSGIQLADELESQTTNVRKTSAYLKKANKYLDLNVFSEPQIDYERYYFNQSASLSLNGLKNLGKNFQARSSINLWRDKDVFQVINERKYFFADSLNYFENNDLVKKPFKSKMNVSLSRNEENRYFENNSQFAYESFQSSAKNIFNDGYSEGNIASNFYFFENNLRILRAINADKKLEIYYDLTLQNNPQSFQDNRQNQLINQQFESPLFFTQLKVGAELWNKKNYRLSLYGLVDYMGQSLKTDLEGYPDNSSEIKQNKLKLNEQNYGILPQLALFFNSFSMNVELPIYYRDITFENRLKKSSSKILERVLVEPLIQIGYKWNQDDIQLNYSLKNNIGDILNLQQEGIYNSFNRFQLGSSYLPLGNVQFWNLRYTISKPLSFFIGSISGFREHVNSNSLADQNLSTNSIENSIVKEDNNMYRHGVKLRLSKYFPNLKSGVKINPQYYYIDAINFYQGKQFKANSKNFEIDYQLDFPKFWNLKIDFNGDFTQTSNFKKNRLLRFENKVLVTKEFTTKLFAELGYSNYSFDSKDYGKNNYSFLDISAIFKTKNVEFCIRVPNILDVKDYQLIYLDPNYSSTFHYQLRGRYVTANAIFNIF